MKSKKKLIGIIFNKLKFLGRNDKEMEQFMRTIKQP